MGSRCFLLVLVAVSAALADVQLSHTNLLHTRVHSFMTLLTLAYAKVMQVKCLLRYVNTRR
jgi:hypothetical protein